MSQPKMICEDCKQPCSARVTGLGSDRVEVFSDCDAPCGGDAILLHADPGDWRMMETAPKDGTEILLLVRHFNWQYAGEHDREKWEQEVTAHWIDHQCGGWTYYGMCGEQVGWRPLYGSPLSDDELCDLADAAAAASAEDRALAGLED